MSASTDWIATREPTAGADVARVRIPSGEAAGPLGFVGAAGAALATCAGTETDVVVGSCPLSADAREPHRIAFYAHELATQFHSHWNKGKDSPHLRFVNGKERILSEARLALVTAIAIVLASALSILGVSAPEEMR